MGKYKQNIRDHAIKRISERLGLELNHEEYYNLCHKASLIKTKKPSKNNREVKFIQINGVFVKIIFDTNYQMIVTVLYLQAKIK